MLSCSVLVPPALSRCKSELPFPAPPYSPTHKYFASSVQVLPATDFPAKSKEAPLHYYLLICWFLSLRAPSSEINGRISVQFYLLVITLIIPAWYLFIILMAAQAPYLSIPGASVGVAFSDLGIHCKSHNFKKGTAFKLCEHVGRGCLGLICLLWRLQRAMRRWFSY